MWMIFLGKGKTATTTTRTTPLPIPGREARHRRNAALSQSG